MERTSTLGARVPNFDGARNLKQSGAPVTISQPHSYSSHVSTAAPSVYTVQDVRCEFERAVGGAARGGKAGVARVADAIGDAKRLTASAVRDRGAAAPGRQRGHVREACASEPKPIPSHLLGPAGSSRRALL